MAQTLMFILNTISTPFDERDLEASFNSFYGRLQVGLSKLVKQQHSLLIAVNIQFPDIQGAIIFNPFVSKPLEVFF
jgi:hypothetical protein